MCLSGTERYFRVLWRDSSGHRLRQRHRNGSQDRSGRKDIELFRRFRMHYGFEVRFCNPRAGYERGNVERKVAFVRKNIFAPINKITDFKAYNNSLLKRFPEMATEVHVCCIIKVPKVAEQKWRKLQLHFGDNCSLVA